MPFQTSELDARIEELKKSPIGGCITGSCLLDEEFEKWDDKPDIDIFVYNEQKYVQAIQWLLDNGYEYGCMKPGKTTPELEEWKYQKFLESGADKKWDVTTIYLTKNGISCNVSLKFIRDNEGHRHSVADAASVIMTFDMNLTMMAWDIQKGVLFDLRETCGMNKRVATPSPYKNWDCTPWRLRAWLRQWERVLKYWDRGFDTRPMAKFYLEKLNEVLDAPMMLQLKEDGEKSAWAEAAEGFDEIRDIIKEWIADKEDC